MVAYVVRLIRKKVKDKNRRLEDSFESSLLRKGGVYLNFQEVYKRIAEDINYLFTSKEDALRYDRTFRAKVISQETNDKYTILYKNKKYIAKSDINLDIDDLVWVCAPQNNWDSLYIQNTNSMRNYEFRADGIYLNGVKITN
jgi:hypothetical protein